MIPLVPISPISPQQRIFALLAGIIIFFLILELVRRRKLKEEYSWIWLLAGSAIALVVIRYELLGFVSRLIGAKIETTTLFIFSIFFLIIVNLYQSLKLSSLTDQIKNLAQKIAILEIKRKNIKIPHKSSKKKQSVK